MGKQALPGTEHELSELRARIAQLEEQLELAQQGGPARRGHSPTEAQAALPASEEQYRRLIEGVRMIVWEYAPATKQFTFVSHHAQDILGFPLDHWREPQFWYKHLHPDDRERAAKFSRDQVARGLDHEHEYRMVRADGEEVWFKDITTVVCDNGKAVSLRGVLIDITERRRIDEALHKSEERFRSLAENSSVGFWQVTAAGQTVYINPAMCRMLQVDDPAQMQGQSFHQYFAPESLGRIRREHERRLAGESSSYEVDIVGARGERRTTIICGAPLRDPSGKVHSMIGTFTDITEQKRIEQSLRESTELQRMTLSELDHRVRNNLAALSALIDISMRDKTDVPEFATSIRSRVQAMSAVHSLLSRAHWQAVSLRRLVETLTPVDLQDAVILDGRDVLITPRQVTALGMILQELVANSLKYGALKGPNGRIELRWTTDEHVEDKGRPLEMVWREIGGPAIPAPPAPGQGTGLILGFVRSELRGIAELTYPAEGAHHQFNINLDPVTAKEQPSTQPGTQPGG